MRHEEKIGSEALTDNGLPPGEPKGYKRATSQIAGNIAIDQEP
jgi:hypothetical protein